MLSIIVAKAKNNTIGKDNKLMWHIKDDLKRFQELTTSHVIIMGRKTFESLGRVLPNRMHIVLSRDKNYKIDNENVVIINDISEIDKYVHDKNENFVIGGEKIYNLLLPKCNKLYITQINKDFEGDSYFPQIDESKWKLTERSELKEDENNIEYEYITYERK